MQHHGLLLDYYAYSIHHCLCGTSLFTQSPYYLFYIFPALAYIFLFIIYDMKLLFMVWRSHTLREIDNPQDLRKNLTIFYIKFCNFFLIQMSASSSTSLLCTSLCSTSGSFFCKISLWCLRSSGMRVSEITPASSHYTCSDISVSAFSCLSTNGLALVITSS